ncbi:MAG TPA: DUF5660 domain-containing protein [Candidatus Woesebacteria bacterium]|nr:DUF5660 domain-containing protein [Candidatus Woesebacteria bacterium]
MSNNWTGQPSNSGNIKIQNFLEALRSSQSKASGNSDGPEKLPGKNIFAEIQAKKEIEKKRVEQFYSHRNEEWNRVFSFKETQTEKRIEEIRVQLKEMSKQVKRLDINLKKAIEVPVVEYGEYQINFLEHIKEMIRNFGLNMRKANSWLEIYNSRSKKMGAYWNMANKKGSSYTQNNERSIATSVG